MEFTQGQVSKIEKISQYIKKNKEQKLAAIQTQNTKEQFLYAIAEIDTLRSGLENLTDTEAIEAAIYRLKAAELDLNRQIKTTKSTFANS